MTLKARKLRLEGLDEIILERYGDGSALYSEVYDEQLLSDAGIHIKWVQDSVSLSSSVGTIRGFHFKAPLHSQDKLVPKGFLHGIMTPEPETEIVYKCSDFYARECDGSVRFDDPELAIVWPLKGDPILNSKDAATPKMLEFDSPFIYGENS